MAEAAPQSRPQLVVLLRERKLRLEKSELRAAVEALSFDETGEHALALHQRANRCREHRVALVFHRIPHRRREDIASAKRDRPGCGTDRRHLHELAGRTQRAGIEVGGDQAAIVARLARAALHARYADLLLV